MVRSKLERVKPIRKHTHRTKQKCFRVTLPQVHSDMKLSLQQLCCNNRLQFNFSLVFAWDAPTWIRGKIVLGSNLISILSEYFFNMATLCFKSVHYSSFVFCPLFWCLVVFLCIVYLTCWNNSQFPRWQRTEETDVQHGGHIQVVTLLLSLTHTHTHTNRLESKTFTQTFDHMGGQIIQ